AELGFRMDDPRIAVLDHPLNRFHGRAPQLQLWGLQASGRADWGDDPVLLVVGASDVPYHALLRRYHSLCERVGPLPPPRVLNVGHGSRRFLLFALAGAAPAAEAACVAPGVAWVSGAGGGGALGGVS